MHNKTCLFFTGIKHSGKTTFAKIIANSLNLDFADSDQLILDATKAQSIRSFYLENGKNIFMEYELSLTKNYIDAHSDFVLSVGGGASDNEKLIELMRKSGKIVYLYRKEKDILPIILKDGIPPFLDKDNPKDSFHTLFSRRDSIYRECADLIIDLGPYGDKSTIANTILEKLKEFGYGI